MNPGVAVALPGQPMRDGDRVTVRTEMGKGVCMRHTPAFEGLAMSAERGRGSVKVTGLVHRGRPSGCWRLLR